MTSLTQQPLMLIGAGRMGLAMLKGWLHDASHNGPIFVVEPNPGIELRIAAEGDARVSLVSSVSAEMRPATVVLAVKPQVAHKVLAAVPCDALAGALLISVMAGAPFCALRSLVPDAAHIVRVMPNLGVSVGRGMTVGVSSEHLDASAEIYVRSLFECLGSFAWVHKEEEIDLVTAISGSGPAYVFTLAEALEHAGIQGGLEPDLAALAARMTIVGAGELLFLGRQNPSELREHVTSPGGTTEAGLNALTKDGIFAAVVQNAVLAACTRARSISQTFSEPV